MNYFEHKELARKEFIKHFVECKQGDTDIQLSIECEFEETELHWALESWDDCEQIKILDDGSVKIKWEHACWWAGCPHHEYYCILAPIETTIWKEPFTLAVERRKKFETSKKCNNYEEEEE